MQHADVLGERHDCAHHVLDEEDGQAFAAVEAAEHLDHLVALGRPEAGHDLVEEQQARPRGERARDLQALAVGQGERGCGQAALGVQAQLLENGPGKAAGFRDAAGAMQSADDDVVEHREPGEGLHDLESAPDPRGADLVRAQPIDSLSFEKNLAGIGRVDARDDVEDRGLAGAVRADQAVDVALGHGERCVAHRAQPAEGLRDVLDFKHRASVSAPPRARCHEEGT
jgi:hypothetical protein